MDSFSRRRPPKFNEPVDFNKVNNLFESGNDYSYSNLLLDRFTGLFSSDWNTSTDHGPFNFNADSPLNSTQKNNFNTNNTNNTNNNHHFGTNGGLYSSNLAHAVNGINSNPFNTKGLNNCDYSNQWIAPRTCPPIGSRNSFNYSTPVNLNNTNNSLVIGSNQQQHLNKHSNSAVVTSNSLNALAASYVPPRVRRRNPTCTECVFCKNNGHPPSFYKGHILKDPEGRIVCPMLRDYDCPICRNGGGDKAHTVRYCPWNKPSYWNNRGGARV